MTDHRSRDYFEQRAEQERRAADNAADERAAHSHRELAERYIRVADGTAEVPRDEGPPAAAAILPRDFRIVP